MSREARMPWSSIADSFSQGGGIWAAISAIFTAACFAAVGLFKIRNSAQIARDADLAARESSLIQHLSAEISRLNTLVIDLDTALKEQSARHRLDMQRERDECNAKMLGLQGEVDILKRRMADEEARYA